MTTHTETDRHDHPTVQALADQLSIPLLWALDAGKIAIDEVPTLERGQELLDWYGSAVEPLWEADQEARAVPLDCPVWCDRPVPTHRVRARRSIPPTVPSTIPRRLSATGRRAAGWPSPNTTHTVAGTLSQSPGSAGI